MAEPILFLPGFMCDARFFAPQIDDLARDHAVMLAPLGPETEMRALAERILAQAPPKFALVGGDLGAMVAMEVARMAPARLTRLALISGTPLPEPPIVAAAREPRIARVKTGRLAEVLREDWASHLAPGAGQDDVLGYLLDMGQALGPAAYISQSRLLQRRPDQQGNLRRIKAPTLVIHGAEGGAYPPDRQTLIADLLSHSERVALPGAGQVPSLEVPDLLTRTLRLWTQIPV